MDILNLIESAADAKKYAVIDYNRHLFPLNRRDYDFIYKELTFNDNCHYVDENNGLNFILKINLDAEIEDIIKNKKFIYISRYIDGSIIQINIENSDEKYILKFDMGDKRHLYSIKKLISNKKAYVHFLISNEDQLFKSHSITLEFDKLIMEKFIYMLTFSYNGCHPRIDFNEDMSKQAHFLTFNYSDDILENLLNIADKLQKWGGKDNFSVCVEKNKNITFNFLGEICNCEYIKEELIKKKFKLVHEGNKSCSGKPFFKYKCGLIYFYKSNLNHI